MAAVVGASAVAIANPYSAPQAHAGTATRGDDATARLTDSPLHGPDPPGQPPHEPDLDDPRPWSFIVGPSGGLRLPRNSVTRVWPPVLAIEASLGRSILRDFVVLRANVLAVGIGPADRAPVRGDRRGLSPLWSTRTAGRGTLGFEVLPAPHRRTVFSAGLGLGIDLGRATAAATETVPDEGDRLFRTTVTSAHLFTAALTFGAQRDRPARLSLSYHGAPGGIDGSLNFTPVVDFRRRYEPERAIVSRRPLLLLSVGFGERW